MMPSRLIGVVALAPLVDSAVVEPVAVLWPLCVAVDDPALPARLPVDGAEVLVPAPLPLERSVAVLPDEVSFEVPAAEFTCSGVDPAPAFDSGAASAWAMPVPPSAAAAATA